MTETDETIRYLDILGRRIRHEEYHRWSIISNRVEVSLDKRIIEDRFILIGISYADCAVCKGFELLERLGEYPSIARKLAEPMG